ncbi:YdcF family protein [Cumulibacter soli]|uniref:YdcF family protein n=1 Tax=Cumulibacter soli TaxID=2546344 RepID=UPI001067E488|nr:YdcF family protein [Cumulibacter soli]
MMIAWWILIALCAVTCVIRYVREPRRLSNGVLVLCTILLVLIVLPRMGGRVQEIVGAYVINPLLIIAVLGYLAMIGFLLVNGVIVTRREGRSLAMLLPLLVSLAMIIVPLGVLYGFAIETKQPGIWLTSVTVFVVMVVGYVGFVFASFATFSLLYRFRRPPKVAGTVVILGSRVIDGGVTPLLASRIERGIELYRTSTSPDGGKPLLICSGGQGADETRSEASAMADYVRERAVPAEDVVEENRSTTTEENLAFSWGIAREHGRSDDAMLVSTNDFHTFRTALLTRRLGIDAYVAAAPTARYYIPAAYLREFVAVVRDYLWIHLGVLALFGAMVGFAVWESFQQH